MSVNNPGGKTYIIIRDSVNETKFKDCDLGYVDGYVTASDSRPYAVVVRLNDGYIDMVPINQIRAIS